MSENKKNLIVIIAGYPDHLEKYFFSFNPGLNRRFPFRFRIDKYSSDELKEIFIDKVKRFKWKFNKEITTKKLTEFFKEHYDMFPNFGGDIENFFKSCQFSHARRIVGKHPGYRTKLTCEDLSKGLERFKNNKKVDETSKPPEHMYM